jgi:hypothetical protein
MSRDGEEKVMSETDGWTTGLTDLPKVKDDIRRR